MAGEEIGFAGSVNRPILVRWDIPKAVFYAEIALDSLWREGVQRGEFRVKPLPRTLWVRRDIAFVIDEHVTVRSLDELIRDAASPFIREVRLFDEFKGKNIPEGWNFAQDGETILGKRSLAFSLAYQKDAGTFTDGEINALQASVGEALKSKFHAEFR